MEKALAEKELWFLPYLFNPTISFNLEYYFDDADTTGIQPSDFDWLDPDLLPDDFNWPSFGNQAGDFKWSIGVTGSLDIFDRGERKTAALKRENTYEIKYIELEEEKEKSDKLLLNILPIKIANDLKEFGKTEPELFKAVTKSCASE